MICGHCRDDVHVACPELARQAAAEGIVGLPLGELDNSTLCDCQHQPRDRRYAESTP